jgi:hypothetical protein
VTFTLDNDDPDLGGFGGWGEIGAGLSRHENRLQFLYNFEFQEFDLGHTISTDIYRAALLFSQLIHNSLLIADRVAFDQLRTVTSRDGAVEARAEISCVQMTNRYRRQLGRMIR